MLIQPAPGSFHFAEIDGPVRNPEPPSDELSWSKMVFQKLPSLLLLCDYDAYLVVPCRVRLESDDLPQVVDGKQIIPAVGLWMGRLGRRVQI